MEITFKGEMHTIPAAAALVLTADRELTREQAEQIKRHVREALPGREVLVLGPGLKVSALERLPVVGMDLAARQDLTVVGMVEQGKVTACATVSPGEDLMEAARALAKRHGGGSGG